MGDAKPGAARHGSGLAGRTASKLNGQFSPVFKNKNGNKGWPRGPQKVFNQRRKIGQLLQKLSRKINFRIFGVK